MIRCHSTLAAAVAAINLLLFVEQSRAQSAQASPSLSYQQRLTNLQLQNVYHQQQTAAELAVQQTAMVVQSALEQQNTNEPSGFFAPPDFQQQSTALQVLLQQTSALQQAQLSADKKAGQSYLLQINTVQNALQTSTTLGNALQVQNGQLTPEQVQLLFQELSNLTGLVGASPPQIQRGNSNR